VSGVKVGSSNGDLRRQHPDSGWNAPLRGNPPVHVTRVSLLEAGDPVNVSELDMGAHSGTHVDAPDHFLAAGAGAEALPLEP